MWMQIFCDVWVHDDTQANLFEIRTGFVIKVSNFTLLWVSKIETHIDISYLHYECVALSHSVRYLLPLYILIR